MNEPDSNPALDQSWMDEAHRRADRSEDAAWDAWDRRPLVPRAELTVAATAIVLGFAWFTLRGAVDVSSNPWQGFMLDGAYPVPVFASALVAFAELFERPSPVVLLNVFARLLGALACAGIAVCVMNAARRIGTAGEAWICALLAAIAFMLAPGVTSAFTAAWPGAITVTCAVWAFATLNRAAQKRRASAAPWLIAGAALCGAATVNHAYFGWTFVLLAAVGFACVRRGTASVYTALGAVAAWGTVIALPAVRSLGFQGESPGVFLGRVLRGPYPALAEQAPNWQRLADLGEQFHPLVWILGLAAVVPLFQRHARIPVGAAFVVVLVAGPLVPFLANEYGRSAYLPDDMAVEAIALAGCAAVFGFGMAAAMQIVFREAHALGYRAALAALVAAIVALHQVSIAPDRRDGLSGAFAKALLDGCPRNSILLVRDPAIAGMAMAAQHAYEHRRDVRVVPVGVLNNSAARQYYMTRHATGLHVDSYYDTTQHADAWQHERPLVTNTLMNAEFGSSERAVALNDLILWEFVRDNFSARPIAFADLDAEWLHARASINGLVQVYPRVHAPLTDSMEAWLAVKTVNHQGQRDPELTLAFTKILVSLSATRRAQDQGEEATRLAGLATHFDQDNEGAWVALARAAARNGEREDANVYSEAGVLFGNGDTERASERLDADLEAYELVRTYRRNLERTPHDPDARQERQELAAELWMKDEIAALAEFMDGELASGLRSARNLYERAATLAQLGDLPAARQYLADAVALSPDEVREHLKTDGRFVLLEFDHQPSPHQTSL